MSERRLFFYFSLFFSLPKFRKGILALLSCQSLSSIDLDNPIQSWRGSSWPKSKKRPKARARFKSDEITLESFGDILTNQTTLTEKRTTFSKSPIKSSTLPEEKRVTFDIKTVVIMTDENGGSSKLFRFNVENVQKYEVALLQNQNLDNNRRVSL